MPDVPKSTNKPVPGTGRSGGGDSGGGAYPNPHQGNPDPDAFKTGGQSGHGYHGPGQLGSEDVDGKENPNAPTETD